MGEFEPQGLLRVSQKHKVARIKEEILKKVKTFQIPYVADAKTILLFDPEATAQEIFDSLEVLKRDLKLRIIKEKNKK